MSNEKYDSEIITKIDQVLRRELDGIRSMVIQKVAEELNIVPTHEMQSSEPEVQFHGEGGAGDELPRFTREFNLDLVNIEQKGDMVHVYPDGWLGDKFEGQSQVAKKYNGKWVSAGKQSHWEFPISRGRRRVRDREAQQEKGQPATQKQLDFLDSLGVEDYNPNITKKDASRLIEYELSKKESK